MSPTTLKQLRARVSRAPTEPGIYRWLDEEGTVIYVGKAKNLKNRLKSYVMGTPDKSIGPWKLSMLKQLADFDVTVTTTELEALILETNLIKQMRPKYNVMMKDDKNYVYVRITTQDAYPKIEITRQLAKDHAKYFGPYLSNFDTKKTLDMLHEFFGWRACRQSIDILNKDPSPPAPLPEGEGRLKPCLDSQIGQCNGLCRGTISKEEYRSRIEQVMKFLRGDYKPILARGKELMGSYAAERKFEKASRIRDGLRFIEQMEEKQVVSDTSGDNTDAVGVALLSGKAQVEVLQKRGGKLIGEHHLPLMGRAESISDVLEQFLPQYYESIVELPDTILVSEDFESRATLEGLLSQQGDQRIHIAIPERGKKSQLLDLAVKNAEEKAKQAEISWEAEERNVRGALDELTKALSLPAAPKRIEGYDISHTGGTETVGSMVVCIDGRPRNDQYRTFTIHSMQRGAVDDYRALKEVLARRLRHITGGYKMEEVRFAENGITVTRAKKDDQKTIEEIIARYPHELSSRDINYKKFIVARHDGDMIGFVRMREWEGKILELSSLWVDESYRGGKLGHFLARSLLRGVKKGKVYVRIFPELEQYYGSVGFRHVLKSPQVFIDRWEQVRKEHPDTPERLVMVYDTLQHKLDTSLSTIPDLLVIDGGKGQLSSVLEVLKEFQLEIPVIGLAKREEEVFLPGQKQSIMLGTDSPAKFLLMRLRDEAHRFANRGREKRALKHAVTSQLDSIPLLGPEAKQKLLKQFGSVDVIRQQPDEMLSAILSEEQIRMLRQVL